MVLSVLSKDYRMLASYQRGFRYLLLYAEPECNEHPLCNEDNDV